MVSLGHCALAHSTTCIVYTQCACSLSLCIYTCMYMCISFMRLTATLGWEVMTSEERLVVSKVDTSRSAPDVQYSLLILSNFTWKIHVYGQEVPPSICRLTTDIPTTMSTAATVSTVLRSLDRSYVCIGNGDDKFQELQRSRKGRFLDIHSKCKAACTCSHYMLLLNVFHLFFTESDPTAYVESRLLSTSTIRHCHCEIAVTKENSRCQACVSYRRCLRIMLTRLESRTEFNKENRTAPCSRVNYCHLTTPEKNRRLSRLHSSLRSANRQIARLKARGVGRTDP